MPAFEIRLEPVPGKFGGPRFLGHFIRLYETDEIQQGAGAQVVGDNMPPWSHPHHHHLIHEVLRQTFHRHSNTPRGIARVCRRNIADDLLADDGLETVRSDQKIALNARAVGKAQLDTVFVLFESGNSTVQSNGVTLELNYFRRE